MKKIILIILILISILTIVFFIGRCSTSKERSQQISNIKAARDSIMTYEIEVGGLKLIVTEKDALVLTERQEKEVSILEIERLKKLHIKDVIANTTLEGEIKIARDSLKLVPGTKIATIKDSTGKYVNYMKIPFQLLKINETYLTLNAGIDTNKFVWFDIKTPVVGEMTIGYKRIGLFKKKPVGVFTTPNKNLSVNDMETIIIKENKKWYDRWVIHIGEGILIDEGIRKLLKIK
jgi:hypothetical protein